MVKETNDEVLDADEGNDESGDTNVNWEAKYSASKERQKSAKATYEKTIAELQSELKTLKKPQDKIEENKSDNSGLSKLYLRIAGITAEDEIELAKDIQKKTGLEWDKLVDDDYFQSKLTALKTAKANADAVSNIKGGGGTSEAKNTAEYWISKGLPPSAEQVPNRKLRAQIARAMMANTKEGKKFYND